MHQDCVYLWNFYLHSHRTQCLFGFLCHTSGLIALRWPTIITQRNCDWLMYYKIVTSRLGILLYIQNRTAWLGNHFEFRNSSLCILGWTEASSRLAFSVVIFWAVRKSRGSLLKILEKSRCSVFVVILPSKTLWLHRKCIAVKVVQNRHVPRHSHQNTI